MADETAARGQLPGGFFLHVQCYRRWPAPAVKPVLVNSSVPFDDWWCSKDSVTLDVQKVTAKFKQKNIFLQLYAKLLCFRWTRLLALHIVSDYLGRKRVMMSLFLYITSHMRNYDYHNADRYMSQSRSGSISPWSMFQMAPAVQQHIYTSMQITMHPKTDVWIKMWGFTSPTDVHPRSSRDVGIVCHDAIKQRLTCIFQ
jgi:hypothetical protein